MAPRTLLTSSLLVALVTALVGCDGDGPAAMPSMATSPGSGAAATSADAAVPTTPVTEPPPAGVCEVLTGDQLRAWYGWPVRGELAVRSPGRCTARMDDGQQLVLRSGTADELGSLLTRLAEPGTPLADFDPADPSTAVEHVAVGRTTAVATDGEQVVVVENRAGRRRLPSFPRREAARFLVARLGGDGTPVPADAIDSLQPVPRRRCGDLVARDPSGRVGLSVLLRGLPFGDTFRDSGRRTVGGGLVGAVSFAAAPADRGPVQCAAAGQPDEAVVATWPLADGTARYRFRPSGSRCLDATVELAGVRVERPDGTLLPVPDVTIRNRTFGLAPGSGSCLYPAP